MEFNWLTALGLFVAATLLDAVFALYTVAVMETKPLRAANLSVLTYLLSAVGIVSYVDNKWYLLPLSLGAFTGCYIVVKREAIKKTTQPKAQPKKVHETDT